jgi:hypothetical protein
VRAVRHCRRHPRPVARFQRKRPATHETARTILTAYGQVKIA